MQGALGKMAIFAVAAAMLGACSQKEPSLMNFRSSGTGPDEFRILPTRPLEQPEDFRTLPAPTPGGTNLTDPDPIAAAAEALGGSGAAATSSPMRASERGVVAYASRYGVAQGIRETLAAEDLEWRRRHDGRVLERLFKTSVYFRAYRAMSLDSHAELERLRRLGIWTPSAPPPPG